MRVKPEDSLFDIVDLSRLWVLADVYEYELPRLRLGQIATITVPYWPERSGLDTSPTSIHRSIRRRAPSVSALK